MTKSKVKVVSFEKAKFEDNEICVDEVSVTYHQTADYTEDRDNVQCVTLSTRNNGCARFINIKTDGWSIDPFSNDFETILKDFCERVSLEQGEKDS